MSSKLTNKIFSTVVSVATVVSISGSSLLVPVASAQTTTQTIQVLIDQINALQAQLNALLGTTGGSTTKCTFTRPLTVGSTGADVQCLQKYLNAAGFKVAQTGAGSPGNESTYFGTLTRAAVAAWQAANGVAPAAGYFGSISQAKYNALVGTTPPGPTPPGQTPPPAMGSGLTVTSGTQLTSGMLHPDNAVRVPYTAVVFTASSDGDVRVDSVTAERQGASTDSSFSGVVLLDEQGVQVGLEKTLNSNHQVVLNESFIVKAGTSRTMWIAANRTTNGSNGTQANFAVVGVSTSATVNGSLPIVGTTRTINVSGLTIGTATVSTGPSKAVATTTEDAGKTMMFTAVRVTAGSVEDLLLRSIRFNQVGTVGTADITSLQVKVDGTVYPHTVSTDGKYYTAVFGSGVTITKGNNVEVTISGTLSGGTNRTVKFDIYRMTDIAVEGKLFGYGINSTAGNGFTTSNPVYWGSQVTIGEATLLVEKDPAVAAQNIALNVVDQPIGGFTVDVKGEPITVAQMVFRVSPTDVSGNNATGANVDQVKLIGPTGSTVAGPTDAVAAGTVTFTDSVTFPVGKGSYKLIAKLDTTFGNNDTISASTTPSSDWTNVTGQGSGDSISPSPSSAVSGNTMTVNSSALTISVSGVPGAQTIISGTQQFTFANYQLDATQSGEDVRMNTLPLEYNAGGNSATSLTSCQLYDGTTSVTTGSNVVNPSSAGSSTQFTFDGSGLVIPKGTSKTLSLKCNIAGNATGAYAWGYDSSSSPSATGLVSGQSVTVTENDSMGQLMTLATSGSYSVTDDSTPGYRIVNSGSTGVVLARLKFSAINEDIDVRRVALQLSGSASNTPLDLVNQAVMLYDELNPTVAIGTAQFANNGDFATSSLFAAGAFRVTANGSRVLLVKGDISKIAVSGEPLTRSGDLLKVDYDGSASGIANGNYGTGVSSGTNLSPSSSDTAVAGVRVMRAYPAFTKHDLSSSERTLASGSDRVLYKFSVTATGGDVHLYKMTFQVSSSTSGLAGDAATGTSYALYAYTDQNFSNADSAFVSDGLINGNKCARDAHTNTNAGTFSGAVGPTLIEIFPNQSSTCMTATTTYKIPAGSTRWFTLKGDITGVEATTGTSFIEVNVEGDILFPTAHQTGSSDVGEMGRAPSSNALVGVDSDSNDDFIWSPASTSTAPTIHDFDYTNGYLVPGLPSVNTSKEVITSGN